MKALVTGATGFVGANLVEALTQCGWQVRAMRRATSNLKALAGLSYEDALGDVTDPDSLLAACRGVDAVFHVAAVATYWRTDMDTMLRANVDGTRNLLAAARAAGVPRVVFTSSSAAIGRPDFGTSADESHAYNLRPEEYPYGHAKVQAEAVVAEAVAGGQDVVIVNPSMIMGPRDVNLISGSIIVTLAKHNIIVAPPGGIGAIDVADVCAGHIAAFERGRTGERYILCGENLWLVDLLRLCRAAVGRGGAVHTVPHILPKLIAYPVDWLRSIGMPMSFNGEQLRLACDTFWFDSAKARRELGLRTRPMTETVERAAGWYRGNGYFLPAPISPAARVG